MLQTIKLSTPSQILTGWGEVKQINENENFWVFGTHHYPANDVEVGTFAHVISSKNDKTTIQVRNIYRVNTELEVGKWYNLIKENDVWTIEGINATLNISSDEFKHFSKMKVVAQDKNLVELVPFVDYKRKTGYSILDSTIRVNDLMMHTHYAGALTDDNLLSGLISYYKTMKGQKKQSILGVTLNVPTLDGEYEKTQLTFIAKTYKGFKNMGQLSTKANHNLVKEVPYLTYSVMREFSEGLICIIPQETSELSNLLAQNDVEMAESFIENLVEIFGQENVVIGLSKHDQEESDLIALKSEKLAKQVGIKCVIGSDAHMVKRDDEEKHDVLRCIGLGTTTDDATRFMYEGDYYHLLSPNEVITVYGQEVVWNSLELAQQLNVKLPLGEIHLPSFPLPQGFDTEDDYFIHLCWEGFNLRFNSTPKDNAEYRERLQFEIDTILKMGFPGYFLIVADFMRFARENGILTGPGRGSACGSMVAYSMQITDVDPIEYGLLFERFLNPDRISMPDIDLDFDDSRREEVIDYVKSKYGVSSVSRIITFGTLSARSVVRDVTRVLNYGYSLGDKIAKAIPNTPGITLEDAFKDSPAFLELYEGNTRVKEIVDISMGIEGLPRNTGVHACGVLIAPGPVVNYLPQIEVFDEESGLWEDSTQVTMSECEELGLLKMDFLGLRTMGVSSSALDLINKKRKEENLETLTFDKLPLDDVRVYEFISKGQTDGVFQLESPGMTVFMKDLFQDVSQKLKTKRFISEKKFGEELFERLVAGISLYRPGPLDEIPNYIKFMLDSDKITYDIPGLKNILSNTYSVIVYQEQVMFIVRELAGFTKGQADTIRKAMGKLSCPLIQ